MQTKLEAIYAGALKRFDGPLTPQSLLLEAEAATGLSDWGADRWSEGAFRKRLDALCHSLESETQLNTRGRSRAHSRLHVMLCSRLRQIAWRTGRPEGPAIMTPLVGTGLPRAGTTFLHNLLAQDPLNFSATAAQAAIPVPSTSQQAEAAAVRDELYSRILDFQGFTSPDVTAIHPYSAGIPEECVFIQEASGASLYGAIFNAPSYAQVAVSAVADAYAWQIGMMQTLYEGCENTRRWTLKAPAHMRSWEAMTHAFPDARIFMNHRDPGKVIPSVASLYAKLRSLFSDLIVDQQAFARQLVTTWSSIMNEVMAWRAAHPEVTVVDVLYSDLIADPIGEAERLYISFGLDFSPEAKVRMERFLKGDSHGKGAARVYSLTEYGLDEAMIEEAFGPYLDHYGIAREMRK